MALLGVAGALWVAFPRGGPVRKELQLPCPHQTGLWILLNHLFLHACTLLLPCPSVCVCGGGGTLPSVLRHGGECPENLGGKSHDLFWDSLTELTVLNMEYQTFSVVFISIIEVLKPGQVNTMIYLSHTQLDSVEFAVKCFVAQL